MTVNMAYIYLVRNIINGKIYIGQTKGSISKRWYRHVYESRFGTMVLGKAIVKHGQENFTIQTICMCPEHRLNDLEKSFIVLFDSRNPLRGYNIAIGGGGGILTEDFGKRVSRGKLAACTKRPDASLRMKSRTREDIIRQASIGGKALKGVPKKGRYGRKGSLQHASAQTYIVECPLGTITVVKNLSEFCRNNGLCAVCMRMVASPKCKPKSHRGGWKCSVSFDSRLS